MLAYKWGNSKQQENMNTTNTTTQKSKKPISTLHEVYIDLKKC